MDRKAIMKREIEVKKCNNLWWEINETLGKMWSAAHVRRVHLDKKREDGDIDGYNRGFLSDEFICSVK